MDLVDRPRLIHRLRARFDAPLVAVVAGAGFGKSVLLRQALLDNRATPRGTDCWMALSVADERASTMLATLADATGADLDERVAFPDLAPLLLDHLGAGTCLVIDDLHRVSEDSPGGQLLCALIDSPPPGLSLLVAGRTAPSVVRRRHALGEVDVIDESDLALRDDEAAQLLGESDSTDLHALGGWPAMVAVRHRLGRGGDASFVLDDVLGDLDPDDRTALAVLAHLGRLDGATAAAALGRPFEPTSLAELPLVDVVEGRIEVHALWGDLLDGLVDADEVVAARRRLAEELLGTGDVVRAGDEFVRLGDDDGVRAAARATCAQGFTRTPADVLVAWQQAMGGEARATPEGLLLDALVQRAADPFAEATRSAIQHALTAIRDRGDVAMEVAALWEFGYVCRARGELPVLLAEIPRAKELALSSDLARPLGALADGMVADVMGDLQTAEAAFVGIDRSDVPPGWRAPVEFMSMWCAYGRGDREAVVARAAAFLDAAPADYPGRPFVAPWVDWIGGIAPADLEELPRPGEQSGSTDGDRLWSGASFGIMWANAGLLAPARAAVAQSADAARSAFLPQHRATAVAAGAALAVAEGDDALARTQLGALLDEPGVQLGVVERSLRSITTIAVVLEPRMREWWHEHPPGPMFDPMVALGDALLDARQGGPAVVPTDALAHLSTSVPLAWAVELVCHWQPNDPRRARRALEQLAADHGDRARRQLRAVVDAGGGAAAAARKLLASVGFRSAPVEVHLLGPTTLFVGGRRADGEDWRRERVRVLAALLAHRRRLRRDEAAGLLWPDMDPDAARRNLRVTLNYLQRLLEPDRLPNEASFYLRQHDDWLELLAAPHVIVDTERLDVALEQADRLRAQGSLRAALEEYRAALVPTPGAPLDEVADHEWARLDADRSRMRLVAAHLAWSSLELALGEPRRAIDAAQCAIGLDAYAESAHRALVAAQLAVGDRAAARLALDRCLEMLDDLGVGPSESTEALARRLGPSAPRT